MIRGRCRRRASAHARKGRRVILDLQERRARKVIQVLQGKMVALGPWDRLDQMGRLVWGVLARRVQEAMRELRVIEVNREKSRPP